jgi:hypothetical protein
MSYFDKPKKTPVVINRVENGYLVSIGTQNAYSEVETYIAKDTELSATVIKAVEIEKKQHDEALERWQEKETKTAEGYAWEKKREEKKKDDSKKQD